jgi:hypothetical protein
MLTEKRALLNNEHRCRRIAREIEHVRASERLIAMAQEYEARAAMFDEDEPKLQRAQIETLYALDIFCCCEVSRFWTTSTKLMHRFKELARENRPQDPFLDGTGLRFETMKHGGEYPDTMPQAIKLIDAEGRSCIYVPITQNDKVVDSQYFAFDAEED